MDEQLPWKYTSPGDAERRLRAVRRRRFLFLVAAGVLLLGLLAAVIYHLVDFGF